MVVGENEVVEAGLRVGAGALREADGLAAQEVGVLEAEHDEGTRGVGAAGVEGHVARGRAAGRVAAGP